MIDLATDWYYQTYGTPEQLVLGMILVQTGDTYDRAVAKGLTPDAFSRPDYAEIFVAMAKAVELGHKTEPSLVLRHLDHEVYAPLIGDLLPRGSLTQNVEPYVDDMLELHWRDAFDRKISDVARRRQSGEGKESLTSAVANFTDDLPGSQSGEKPDAFHHVLDATLRDIEDQLVGGNAGIPTGIKKLDEEIYGFQPGLVYFIGGRPSMGKTALAINFALNAARLGRKVIYFTIEMPAQQIMKRVLSMLGRIDSAALQRGDLTEQQRDQLMYAARQFHKLPLRIDDTSGYFLSRFLAKCKRVKRADGLDLVILDYVQDMVDDTGKYGANRQAEMSVINRALKKMAKDLMIPFIGVVQVSRDVDKAEKPTIPKMSDIKESGSFEQVADTVLFVHRESYYQSGHRNIIAIAKNRHGERNKAIDIRVDLSIGYMGD